MFEIKELNVEDESFEKDLMELSEKGYEVKCSYTKRDKQNILGEYKNIVRDFIILQRRI